ncbi:NADH:flavin oxidoreductase [Caulobacter mirabilis]|uniref:NADH:flavin oxidoreductase n=1 Tax=Caulobacter mirabilis TaxID=69666 RepID=A0A2D2AZP4_9CAUL|nr:NADH:flavin oxidoreductase [Caulobacter mirabilis]ATQ43488.1 NADH:flavin oxidoreductase [Caulobacter mirabilis]
MTSTRDLFEPLSFAHGPSMRNRLMLAPLTNLQSHADGTISDDEFRWLTKRAEGGFGLTMTCAAHVQRQGQGFPGQLGIWSDDHLPGLTRLASAINATGGLSSVQLHHAGMRSPVDLIGQTPVCPSDDPETGARALTGDEVEQLTEDFIAAAVRAKRAGFHGIEVHGAHGYILCQFLSPTINRRTDRWGGDPENRARIVVDILKGVRARCGEDFQIGLRLSPERFGMELAEIRALAGQVMSADLVDYLDMSLWDAFKKPNDEAFQDRDLTGWFTDLPRGRARLGVAGKIMTPAQATDLLARGCDYVLLGRAAILHHDWPKLAEADAGFAPASLPVTRDHLRSEGLGEAFVNYMATWKGFVREEAA